MDDRQSGVVQTREVRKITVQDAWDLLQGGSNPFFLDTRNLKHYSQSNERIPGSVRIWRDELVERIDELPADRTIIACCNCHRENSSGKAVQILYEHGFDDAYALLGGMRAWIDAGLPLVPKEVED